MGSGDGYNFIAAPNRREPGDRLFRSNSRLVLLSRKALSREGVELQCAVQELDIYRTDLAEATVRLSFIRWFSKRSKPRFCCLKAGSRIVEHTFDPRHGCRSFSDVQIVRKRRSVRIFVYPVPLK
jgi:hypothetical protein